MIKLGVVDFDTSHVVEFTRRLNHKGIPKDQWVDGAEVVIGCPGESKIMPERIPGYTKEMKELDVKLVDKPEDMIGQVDGMLIESQSERRTWDGAGRFPERGVPGKWNNPLSSVLPDARRLAPLE